MKTFKEIMELRRLNKDIREFKSDIANIKEEYPLYTPHCEIEYQLDINEAVVLIAFPYENAEDSDYELETSVCIDVKYVYEFIKEIDTLCSHIIISDTTDGNYRHEDTLENTLKEYSHYFYENYGCGKNWETK